ncbi:MAG: hypothetical protein KJ057_05815 [Phycisphaerae bacterium]|nr:MAG: hypothetical protein EDS66_01270 [Planctomycetota bacterium]KAB2937588.1 MAG: outer membrane protein assembly factor BamE [Phycisphaerae bacterium]MBE7458063.1 hypothetical protein [Planctomycetia bacterium]MCK6464473.1 outer membrane protein assembly factor BamE [Phycisphaerae bacterium]MCL4717977.1 hypothetical protein [Phycisphaerae bacterium]
MNGWKVIGKKSVWVLAAVGLLAGCDKLTVERFNMIRNGDSADMVEATLGTPNTKIPGTWEWVRHDRGLDVLVHFDKDGRVVSKSWTEPGRVHVEDLPGATSEGDAASRTRVDTVHQP